MTRVPADPCARPPPRAGSPEGRGRGRKEGQEKKVREAEAGGGRRSSRPGAAPRPPAPSSRSACLMFSTVRPPWRSRQTSAARAEAEKQSAQYREILA